MNTKNTIILIIILAALAVGLSFFVHPKASPVKDGTSDVVGNEEQKAELSKFAWSFTEADTLNGDGIPNTNVYLEATYKNGKVENKLVATTQGSCFPVDEKEEDTLAGTENIQCYAAGFGEKFKITKGATSYQVQSQEFEEGSPEYDPPVQPFKLVAEFPLTK